MFDNFLEEEYHPSDPVFTHPRSSHLIFIGDVQSALDTDSLSSKNITTGTPPAMQWSPRPRTWTISATARASST